MIRNNPPKREGGKMRIRAFPVSNILISAEARNLDSFLNVSLARYHSRAVEVLQFFEFVRSFKRFLK